MVDRQGAKAVQIVEIVSFSEVTELGWPSVGLAEEEMLAAASLVSAASFVALAVAV